MKKLIVFLVLILCSCSSNTEHNEFISKPQSKQVAHKEAVISEASTVIIDNGENRINNILLACQKVSGMKLSPEEEFSFNNVTGKKNAKNGYKVAPVLVDGEKSYGIGGGVCQVSTTIYMTALAGGFEITEHHNHSESVAYAPDGNDATVVYGVKDFKFVNNTDSDIYIYVWVNNNNVISKIIKK